MACNCKSSTHQKVVVKQVVKNPDKKKVSNVKKPISKRVIRRYY